MSDGSKIILMLVFIAVFGLVESFLIIRSVMWLERKFGKDKAKLVLGVVAVSLGILMIVAPYFYLFVTWPNQSSAKMIDNGLTRRCTRPPTAYALVASSRRSGFRRRVSLVVLLLRAA